MKAYIFPGQGAQFSGMGLDLFESSQKAKDLFLQANEVLGFEITKIMFEGTADELKETKVTQPAIFLHSTIIAEVMGDIFQPNMVAGHSLGEISALVANKTLAFKDGLQLVSKRALAMQKACEQQPSTMAAVLGLEDNVVETICSETSGIVQIANYNCPGQLVISGTKKGVARACKTAKAAGARKVVPLDVSIGAHTPLMAHAISDLASLIEKADIQDAKIPIIGNVNAEPLYRANEIRQELLTQLMACVRWTNSMRFLVAQGVTSVIEIGAGKVLTGLMKRIHRKITRYNLATWQDLLALAKNKRSTT